MRETKGTVPLVTSTDRELAPEDRARGKGRLEDGLALCLSGGGYRAMLFHLGALWCLNDRGWLPRLARVSSVSGGSITAAVLGMKWRSLEFDDASVATNFDELVVAPLRKMASTTIDRGVLVGGLLTFDSIGERLISTYRKTLFGDATLQDLPNAPRFVINATNVQSGCLFRFSKPYVRDYRVGKISKPKIGLAEAVAASSAFPPLLSPVRLRFRDGDYVPGSGDDLQRPPFTTKVMLTDGGVYDNLGIETVWKRYRTILVSDAGGKMSEDRSPRADWLLHSARIMAIVDNQVRSLRKRQLIAAYRSRRRSGAYWGIRSDIEHYGLDDALPCPHDRTMKLAEVPTRLAATSPKTQQRLVNWGYAVCDAALRRHVDRKLAAPSGFPYPDAGV